MKEEYTVFKDFTSLELAKKMELFLNENDIETVIGDNSASGGTVYLGGAVNNRVEVRIKQCDFKKAKTLLAKENEVSLEDVDPTYYLFEFTNEELYEILLKSDEWGEFDYHLAKKILVTNGKSIDEDLLNSLKNQRIKDLAKPEGNQGPWIVAGYILVLFGGFLGIIIGYSIWTSKKTLPDGSRIYS